MSAVSTSTGSNERYTGRVKWFNNKAGYGFITITDGLKSGTDVFVHHSSICVDSEQYKYLVQGEYVDFSLMNVESERDHEYQAGEVCGIKGGKLMCETRRDTRTARAQHRTSQSGKETREPSVQRLSRTQHLKEKHTREEEGEWTFVAKSRQLSEQKPAQRTSSTRGRGRYPKSSLVRASVENSA